MIDFTSQHVRLGTAFQIPTQLTFWCEQQLPDAEPEGVLAIQISSCGRAWPRLILLTDLQLYIVNCHLHALRADDKRAMA